MLSAAVNVLDPFDPEDLIRIFNACFQQTHQTVLVRGGDEPIYLPATTTGNFNQVVFARGYFSSGLHEIAHWLVAGEQRRQHEDYGYWYQPDGRTADQQREFERVEVTPQALEWILAKACGKPFRLSLDNLSGEATDSGQFASNVLTRVERFVIDGLNRRSHILRDALCQFYGTTASLTIEDFNLNEIYRP